jgi:hypothetical protein
MTKEEFHKALTEVFAALAQPKPAAVKVQQKYIDEINRYGEIRSREEFCKEAREHLREQLKP